MYELLRSVPRTEILSRLGFELNKGVTLLRRKEVIPIIDRLIANPHFRHITKRLCPAFYKYIIRFY